MTRISPAGGDLAGEVARSWPVWADAADDTDQHDLALALLSAAPAAEDGSDIARAALLLQTGHPGRAVALLAANGYADLPEVSRATWPDLVLAAGRAGTGDASAYRCLMACARHFDDAAEAWRLCYLVAAAADGVGDRPTADQAWVSLVTRFRILTTRTVAEFSAAEIAGRDRRDPQAATMTVATAVAFLHHVGTPVEQDPEPVLRAVRALRQRGDAAGARLLLHAVRRRIPPSPALDAALAALTPATAMRRHLVLVVAAWCLAPVLFPLGFAGGLIVLAVRLGWQRWLPIPGLTRTDSVAWRAFRSLGYDPHTDPDEPPPKDQTGYYGLAALLSLLFIAFPLGAPATALVAAVTGAASADDANRAVIVGTWVLLCTGIPGLAFLGARQVHRLMRARRHRRRREAAHRVLLAAADRCRCWQARTISGPFAAEYRRRHLVDEPAAHLLHRLPGAAGLARCPTTGALWLTLDAQNAGTALLLRGAAPADNVPQSEAGGLYL